jgi:hypothetical protein
MALNYTYEIISADAQARCMEVVYSSEGFGTRHISARLPYEGESLEDIIKMYSPVAAWLEQQNTVVAPEIGTTGVISVEEPVVLTDEEQAQALENANMWAAVKFEQDVAKALVKFGVLESDPTVIPVSSQ